MTDEKRPPDARPTLPALAEVLQTFMQFPAPLALVGLDGAVVLTNEALTARFGRVSIVPESVRTSAQWAGDDGSISIRSMDGPGTVEVRTRAIRMPDRIILILDGPRGGEPESELERLRQRVSTLEKLAATDHLTGAWNRAHFERLIVAELTRSLASRQPLSLVLADVDHFKNINDTFGHGVGDSVLGELVRLIRSGTRASDALFRWGGEEFAVLASSVGHRGAERLAENLCRAVAEHPFRTVGSVTISVGVAEHLGSEDREVWFERLDAALYAAKHAGRNRVVVDRRGNSDAWAAASSASALHLVWQEGYECGDPTIDGEHRELFALANRLIEASMGGEGAPAHLRSALDALLEHVRRHFADEEAILARYHYGDLEQHKRAHDGLLRRAAYLKDQAQAGEAKLGAVVEFLAQDVVARHLMVVDRAFFPLFEKGPPAGP